MGRKNLLSLASVVVALGLLVSGSASAVTKTTTKVAANPNGSAQDSGLKVSPVRADLTIPAGTSQIVPVYVDNVTSTVASYQVEINDFTAGTDESGEPQIILDNSQYAPTHSLKRLVGAIPNIIIQPGQTVTVNVPITIPKTTTAGGYYGAVRFVPASSANAVNKNVTLSASVGSLVLVTVPGDIHEDVGIASLDVRKQVPANKIDSPHTIFTSSKNLNGVVRFENSGDVQEQPFGKMIVKNFRGKVLDSYEVNNETPRGNVLPDSVRKFELPLQNLGTFGKYTLEGNFGYGNSGQLITAKTTFYVIPVPVLIVFILIILAIIFLIFGLPRLIRAYNRRVVSRAQRSGRRAR